MLDYLSIGNDISKVRSRLFNNIQMLESQELDKSINNRLKWFCDKMKNERADYDDRYTFIYYMLAGMLKRQLPIIFGHINSRPFRINRFAIIAVEMLFAIENPNESNPINYLFKFIQQTVVLNGIAWSEAGSKQTSDKQHIIFLRGLAEESQYDSEYLSLFSYTLRQTPLIALNSFLEQKQKSYQGDFISFLEMVLLDDLENKIISKKQNKFCKKWIKHQSSITNKPNYLPEPSVPEGWVILPGRLKEEALKQFFSFLYLEKDRAGNSLLTREDTEELLKYGFAYPEQAEVGKRLTLDTACKIPLWFIYHMFYELYQAHKKTLAPKDYKDHFAYFLKHRFTNFGHLTVNMLKNSLRNYEQINSRRRGFDITTYLPVNGQKTGR